MKWQISKKSADTSDQSGRSGRTKLRRGRKLLFLSLGLILVILAGCGDSNNRPAPAGVASTTIGTASDPAKSVLPIGSPVVGAIPTPPPSVATAAGAAGGVGGVDSALIIKLAPLLGRIRADVAQKGGVSTDAVGVRSIQQVEWSSSALGCPQPGMVYSQVITDGYLIVLDIGGKSYEYHSDTAERFVACDSPEKPLPGR